MGTREKEGEFYGRFGGLSTLNMIYFLRRPALCKIPRKHSLSRLSYALLTHRVPRDLDYLSTNALQIGHSQT